ncbi:MAG: DUF1122 family protein [Dehalococcoidia bacterium]
MNREPSPVPGLPGRWIPVDREPSHPLAALDGQELVGVPARVFLGPTSRFGARYFVIVIEASDGRLSRPVLQGLHRSGPLPSYNWVEIAETSERATFLDGDELAIGSDGVERLLRLLLGLLPAGGHVMVEYDSTQRAETARDLAHNVPALATPLGELLFRVGCGAKFKDWQIAEGGAEGPRKLQAYKPLSQEHAQRWREEASRELRAFLERTASDADTAQPARQRAEGLLRLLDDTSAS